MLTYKSLFNEVSGNGDEMTIVNLTVTDQLDITGAQIIGTDELKINRIAVANGSAGTPSYTFQNDIKTGIYLQAPGEMAIAVNGVKRMEFQPGFIRADTNFVAENLTADSLFVSLGPSFFHDTVRISNFNSGVIHSNSNGDLSSSLITNDDIKEETIKYTKLEGYIPDSKLMTIVTPGKIENSATSATPYNTPFTLVERDSLGNIQVNLLSSTQVSATTIITTNLTATNATISGNIIVSGTVDGRDISTDGTNLDYLYTTLDLAGLTNAEVKQLQNIDSNIISNTQWGYLSVLNQSIASSTSPSFAGLTLSGLNARGILGLNGSNVVTSRILTNGQLMIGNTGSVPSIATLTGTSNQIIVTNGTGSITLSLPQNIATTSGPTFASLTVNGNIAVSGTVDGRNVSVDGTNLDYLYATLDLAGLTNSEVKQLQNIDSNTIN